MAHGDITHVEIPVTDLEAGRKFYADLFGWNIEALPEMPEYPMWQAPNQISGGALAPRDEGFTQPRSIVEVDSIDETLAKATAAGATVLAEKSPISETSWYAIFIDPDGNQIGLFEGSYAE